MSPWLFKFFFMVILGPGLPFCYAEEPTPEPVPLLEGSQAENYQRDLQVDRLNLSKYDPIYLLYGDPISKLQFSFKYKLLQNRGLYFGYTQVIFWDLRQDSKPMRDVNYGPDFFYRQSVSDQILETIDLGMISHLSNGREGAFSRGYTANYLRFNFKTSNVTDTLKGSLKLSNLFAIEETNPDLQSYVSPLEFRFVATEFYPGIFDRGELSLRLFPGGRYAQNWHMGGQEVSLSFRLGGLKLVPALYLQYFHGYGESLLDYAISQSVLRCGLIL